jgi:hypothetical protein
MESASVYEGGWQYVVFIFSIFMGCFLFGILYRDVNEKKKPSKELVCFGLVV